MGYTPNGIAFDSRGEVFLSTFHDVAVFSNPETQPQLVRHMTGEPFATLGLAYGITIDYKEELYVYNRDGSTSPNSIVAYNSQLGGRQDAAFGTFTSVADIAETGDIVAGNGYLYATFSGPDGSGVNAFSDPSYALTTPAARIIIAGGSALPLALGP